MHGLPELAQDEPKGHELVAGLTDAALAVLAVPQVGLKLPRVETQGRLEVTSHVERIGDGVAGGLGLLLGGVVDEVFDFLSDHRGRVTRRGDALQVQRPVRLSAGLARSRHARFVGEAGVGLEQDLRAPLRNQAGHQVHALLRVESVLRREVLGALVDRVLGERLGVQGTPRLARQRGGMRGHAVHLAAGREREAATNVGDEVMDHSEQVVGDHRLAVRGLELRLAQHRVVRRGVAGAEALLGHEEVVLAGLANLLPHAVAVWLGAADRPTVGLTLALPGVDLQARVQQRLVLAADLIDQRGVRSLGLGGQRLAIEGPLILGDAADRGVIGEIEVALGLVPDGVLGDPEGVRGGVDRRAERLQLGVVRGELAGTIGLEQNVRALGIERAAVVGGGLDLLRLEGNVMRLFALQEVVNAAVARNVPDGRRVVLDARLVRLLQEPAGGNLDPLSTLDGFPHVRSDLGGLRHDDAVVSLGNQRVGDFLVGPSSDFAGNPKNFGSGRGILYSQEERADR